VRQRPVLFGEVLFDCFSDGSKVLGGAPFNVAWHLRGLGLHPILVSRVGADDMGQTVREAMRQWGLSVEGLQTDATRPTGVVEVSLEEGQPSFDIRAAQAYDNIEAEAACGAVANQPLALLYHGTLALREGPSSVAVQALREATELPTLVDLNLREPWWTDGLVRRCLETARWLKLNQGELAQVTRTTTATDDARQEACRGLFREHALEAIFLTRGADGADIFTREGRCLQVPSAPVANLVDTVGAGDALSAVIILGLISQWPLEVVLHRATRFAADICGLRGATTSDRVLYARCLETWRREDGDA
jgi:fructokinase